MLNSKDLKFKKLKICILTISSSRNLSNDKSGNTLEDRVKGFGHELFDDCTRAYVMFLFVHVLCADFCIFHVRI